MGCDTLRPGVGARWRRFKLSEACICPAGAMTKHSKMDHQGCGGNATRGRSLVLQSTCRSACHPASGRSGARPTPVYVEALSQCAADCTRWQCGSRTASMGTH